MKIEITKKGDATVVAPSGLPDSGREKDDLGRTLHELAAKGAHDVIVDLGKVSILDDRVIGILVHAHVSYRGLGARLKLCRVGMRMQRYLEAAKVTRILEIHGTLEEALQDSTIGRAPQHQGPAEDQAHDTNGRHAPSHGPPPRTLFIEDISEEELRQIERRMKDPRFSRAGFLGPDESLRDVIREDARKLSELGVSHELIALRLDEICWEGWREVEARPDLRAQTTGRPEGTLDPVETRWGAEMWARKKAYEALHKPLPWPGIRSEPDCFRFYLETMRPLLLPSGFGFAYLPWLGYQYCPFGDQLRAGPEPVSPCGATDCDYLITNPRRMEWIAFSGLLPHLIEAHHFFEGLGTPYRLDPELAVRLLELGPFQRT